MGADMKLSSCLVLIFALAVGSWPDYASAAGPNIARGMKYTIDPAPSAFPNGYQGQQMCTEPGDAVQLTDGEVAQRAWWDAATVGWRRAENIQVVIDLQQEKPIGSVAFGMWSEKDGWRVPNKVLVMTSNDMKSFHVAGELNSDAALLQWDTNKKVGAQDGLPRCRIVIEGLRTRGRYVALIFWASQLYLDEIEVFSDGLSLQTVDISGGAFVKSLDVFPFASFARLHIAREASHPVALKLPVDVRYNWASGLPIYLDLPEGVLLKGPQPAEVAEIVEDGNTWRRHKIDKARVLYLQSELEVGTVRPARIVSQDVSSQPGREQMLEIETISIPRAPVSSKLRTSVGFAFFADWKVWPDAVGNYKHMGFSVFAPFSETDIRWLFMKGHSLTPEALKMIEHAKAQGMVVGAWMSPFNNNALARSAKSGPRAAVHHGTGSASAAPCPRAYMQPEGEGPSEEGEIAQASMAAKSGVEFFLFDSEPDWGGTICTCGNCAKLWSEFLEKRGAAPRTLDEAWTQSKLQGWPSGAHSRLLQEFWDEFYGQLWGGFRKSMASAAEGRTVTIGLYNYPKTSDLKHQYMGGNHGRFEPLYKDGIVDFAAPENYLVRTADYGELMRSFRRHLPESCPMHPIVSCGAAGMIGCERSATDLKHRLYEIFCNGGQGYHAWSISGASGEDFRAFAEVNAAMYPYEDMIVSGKLIDAGCFTPGDSSASANGITDGKRALVLISRYGKSSPAKVIVRINRSKLGFNAAKLSLVGQTRNVVLKDGVMVAEFDGTPDDFVKVVCLE